MIQRIQTVYLFIVAILTGLMHFMPLAGMGIDGDRINLTIYGLKSAGENAQYIMSFPYMGIIVSLSCALALIIIFLYKRRQIQIRLCFAQIILLIGAQIFAVMYIMNLKKSNVIDMDTVTYGVASVFPIVCVILTYLALRMIIKDEAKVRSLDRIR